MFDCCYFSGWVWRILYGIYYEGKLIDSRTLPSIDIAYLQSRLYTGVPVHFLTSINYYSDRSFSLYVQDKVSWLNYGNYEWALKQTWLQTYQSSKLLNKLIKSLKWERSGSVVECLTRDRRAAGSSLTGVTALWSLSKTHLS